MWSSASVMVFAGQWLVDVADFEVLEVAAMQARP